jgi:hypothetical protein
MNERKGQDPGVSDLVRRLAEVADPDVSTLSEAELDAELADCGIDFVAFNAQLDVVIVQAKRRSLLKQARAGLEEWQARASDVRQGVVRSLEDTRKEIECRLSGLEGAGHPRALVYFQQYEGLPDQDLPDLLRELELLDELDAPDEA